MQNSKFTWLPFFEELLNKICTEYDSKTLYSVWQEYFPNQYKSDTIDVMDPFSFIGKINSFGGFDSKNNLELEYCKKLKKTFNLKAEIPNDFHGIPKTNSVNPVFFYEIWPDVDHKKEEVMKNLWTLAESINNENLDNVVFKKVLTYSRVGLSKLTQLFFLCKPNKYYSYDNINREFYETKTEKDTSNDVEGFYDFQTSAKEISDCCYKYSFEAWKYCNNLNLHKLNSNIQNSAYLSTTQKTNATSEVEYIKYTYKQLSGVRLNKHNPLEKSFKKFLISKGVKEDNIKQNCHFTDFIFTHKGKKYLCELKPSTQAQIKYAIRLAIGQLIEYDYNDKSIYDYKVIIFQGKPTKEVKLYLTHLKSKYGLYYLGERKKGYFIGNLQL